MTNIPRFTLRGDKAEFSKAVYTVGSLYALLDSLVLTNFEKLPEETANDVLEGLNTYLNRLLIRC